jgi:hypothetical protein
MNSIASFVILSLFLVVTQGQQQEFPRHRRVNSKFAWRYYELFKRPETTETESSPEIVTLPPTTTTSTTEMPITTTEATTTTSKSPVPKWMSPYGCKSSADCDEGECCAIGHTRFAVPRCMSFARSGEYCRRDNDASNRTIYYPNGDKMDLTNVYTMFCPCFEGLACFQSTCQDGDAFNSIESEEALF